MNPVIHKLIIDRYNLSSFQIGEVHELYHKDNDYIIEFQAYFDGDRELMNLYVVLIYVHECSLFISKGFLDLNLIHDKESTIESWLLGSIVLNHAILVPKEFIQI